MVTEGLNFISLLRMARIRMIYVIYVVVVNNIHDDSNSLDGII